MKADQFENQAREGRELNVKGREGGTKRREGENDRAPLENFARLRYGSSRCITLNCLYNSAGHSLQQQIRTKHSLSSFSCQSTGCLSPALKPSHVSLVVWVNTVHKCVPFSAHSKNEWHPVRLKFQVAATPGNDNMPSTTYNSVTTRELTSPVSF